MESNAQQVELPITRAPPPPPPTHTPTHTLLQVDGGSPNLPAYGDPDYYNIAAADAMTSLVAHETAETITDPFNGTAWVEYEIAGGQETQNEVRAITSAAACIGCPFVLRIPNVR